MISALLAVGLAGASVVELASYDLDTVPEGFVDRYDAGSTPQWALGAVGNGPAGGWDGPAAWSTGLLADYLNDSTNCLEVPVPDLGGAARPMFRFQQWYAIGAGDSARVLVDLGAGWAPVAPVYGYPDGEAWTGDSAAWELAAVDLTGLGAAPRVCLLFVADDDGVVGDGWFVDNLGFYDGDVVPPQVLALDSLADTEDLVGPYEVRVEADDDVGVAEVELFWTVGGAESSLTMDGGATSFSAFIPGQPPDTQVKYWAVARDAEGNATRAPIAGERSFRVFLPAPRDLDGPDGRVVGASAVLTWSPPDSSHPVRGYAVYRGDEEVARTGGLSAEVTLSGGPDTFVVRAEYDAGLGDASDPVVVDGLVPSVDGLSPAEGFPGDQLRLALTGTYLLMVDGAVQAAFDGPVTVTTVDVRDVELAYLSVVIADDAAAGTLDLTLTTPVGEVGAPAAFTVRDAGERPRLLTLDPARVRQGQSEELVLTWVGDFAATPTVDAGEGVVVEAVTVDGDALRVAVAVANDAPLGAREVVVDDGVRRYTGVSLEVTDVVVSLDNGCHAVPGPAGAGAILGLLLGLGRRRRA